MNTISKTISITIPGQLEEDLQIEADKLGISRSRFIGNLLLDWQKNKSAPNDCDHNSSNEFCDFFNIECKASQKFAETCEGYIKK